MNTTESASAAAPGNIAGGLPPQAKLLPNSFKVGRVTVYARKGTPHWWARYRLNGIPQRHSLKVPLTKKKAATMKAEDIVRRLLSGDEPQAAKRSVTLREAIEKFLKWKERQRMLPQTRKELEFDLNEFTMFVGRRGVTRLEQATVEMLEEYHEALRNDGIKWPAAQRTRARRGAPVSEWTQLGKLKAVKGLGRFAARKGLLPRNPFEGFDLPPVPDVKAHCFTDQEVQTIPAAVDEAHRLIFEFLPVSGLRSDELCHLELTDVDLSDPEDPKIHVRGGKSDGWKPKTRNDRVVALTPDGAEVLRRAVAKSPGPWLFVPPASTYGRKSLGRYRPERVRQILTDARGNLGIKQGKVHSYRHYYCSYMARMGVDAFSVMTLLGHSSLKIVLTYYHVNSKQLAAAVRHVKFPTSATPSAPPATTTAATAEGSNERKEAEK